MDSMPWWAVLYALLFAGAAVWSAVEEARKGARRWWLATDALVSLVWVAFIVAYYAPPLGRPASRAALALLVAAFLWTAINAQREIGQLQSDPDLSPRLNWLGDILAIALGAIFVAPAIAYGVLVVRRGWDA